MAVAGVVIIIIGLFTFWPICLIGAVMLVIGLANADSDSHDAKKEAAILREEIERLRAAVKLEVSCGIVVYTKEEEDIKYLVIESKEGIHGFPKGHIEQSETEKETARRETYEETGLRPQIVDGFRYVVEYPLPQKPGVTKQVIYFLGIIDKGAEIKIQDEELNSAAFYTFNEAMALFEFDNTKEALTAARDFIHNQ